MVRVLISSPGMAGCVRPNTCSITHSDWCLLRRQKAVGVLGLVTEDTLGYQIERTRGLTPKYLACDAGGWVVLSCIWVPAFGQLDKHTITQQGLLTSHNSEINVKSCSVFLHLYMFWS